MSDHYDRYNGMENLLSTNLASLGTDVPDINVGGMISRQAVKELAHNQMREKYCGMALKKQRDFYIKLADSIIDLLPAVHPEPHWIPVTERLPEKDGEYLTTWIDAQKKLCVNVFLVENGVWYWNQNYIFPKWRIIAWMPLPEPYKEVTE